jgi:hypothetical protein
MLDIRYWMLDIRYWMLDIRYWMLDDLHLRTGQNVIKYRESNIQHQGLLATKSPEAICQ